MRKWVLKAERDNPALMAFGSWFHHPVSYILVLWTQKCVGVERCCCISDPTWMQWYLIIMHSLFTVTGRVNKRWQVTYTADLQQRSAQCAVFGWEHVVIGISSFNSDITLYDTLKLCTLNLLIALYLPMQACTDTAAPCQICSLKPFSWPMGAWADLASIFGS